MKKAISIALALCMALVLGTAALATSATTSTVAAEGNATTTLNGTIAATQLNVTVPSAVTFTMDPTVDVNGVYKQNPVTDQITAPEITIKNESLVPIYTKIDTVLVDGITLVQDESGLQADKTAMLGFKQEGEITDFATQNDWLVGAVGTGAAQSTTYTLNQYGGRIEAKDKQGSNGLTDTMTLNIYGQTKTGWEVGDTFTITPTIVVSTKAFS